MSVDYKQINIVICNNQRMVLPVYTSAFKCTKGDFRKISRRYTGSFVLNENGSVSEIIKVAKADKSKNNLFDMFVKNQTIEFVIQSTKHDFFFFLKKLIAAATSTNSYSVWTQFYNTQGDLEKALLNCKNLKQICEVLYISGDKEISYMLV